MNKTMYVTTHCPECNREANILVTEEEYRKRKAGALAQVAFPELSPPVREQLITGICPACWDIMFKDDDDDC